jgi:DNA gyrase subunit A
MLVTADGQSIRFKASQVRDMGRTATGVKGMEIDETDNVVGLGIISPNCMKNPTVMIMSNNGYGKSTPIDEYKVQNRGGSGIKTANVTDKTGPIVGAKIVTDDDSELIAISQKSQVIRTELDSIPVLGTCNTGCSYYETYERVMQLQR